MKVAGLFLSSIFGLALVSAEQGKIEFSSPSKDSVWFLGGDKDFAETINAPIEIKVPRESSGALPDKLTLGVYSASWFSWFPIAEFEISKKVLLVSYSIDIDYDQIPLRGSKAKVFLKLRSGWFKTWARSDTFQLFKVGPQVKVSARLNAIESIKLAQVESGELSATVSLFQTASDAVLKRLRFQLIEFPSGAPIGKAEKLKIGKADLTFNAPADGTLCAVEVTAIDGMFFASKKMVFRSEPFVVGGGPKSLEAVPIESNEKSSDHSGCACCAPLSSTRRKGTRYTLNDSIWVEKDEPSTEVQDSKYETKETLEEKFESTQEPELEDEIEGEGLLPEEEMNEEGEPIEQDSEEVTQTNGEHSYVAAKSEEMQEARVHEVVEEQRNERFPQKSRHNVINIKSEQEFAEFLQSQLKLQEMRERAEKKKQKRIKQMGNVANIKRDDRSIDEILAELESVSEKAAPGKSKTSSEGSSKLISKQSSPAASPRNVTKEDRQSEPVAVVRAKPIEKIQPPVASREHAPVQSQSVQRPSEEDWIQVKSRSRRRTARKYYE